MWHALKDQLTKDFVKISIGNILEWYDFTLYGIFAVQLSNAFFGEETRSVGLLMVFMTFAVGFLARPIGAVIFGLLGDRYGRKYAVNLSIWLMVIPTVLIAFIPTYWQIGISAPIILIILRILQGLSAGGQFSGLIVVANDYDTKYRSFLVSLVYSISVVGSLLAAFVGYICIKLAMVNGNSLIVSNIWRLPFLLSSIIFLIYFKVNHYDLGHAEKKPIVFSFYSILKSQPTEFITLMIFAAANGAIYYILFNYLVTYLEVHLQIGQTYAFVVENSILLLSIILYPLFGYYAGSRSSRIRSSINNVLWMILSVLLFYLSNYSPLYSIIGLIILVINECALTSYMISFFVSAFDNRYRMTAFSIAFNIGATLSGFAPLFAEYISKFSKFAILGFLGLALVVILISLIRLNYTQRSVALEFGT